MCEASRNAFRVYIIPSAPFCCIAKTSHFCTSNRQGTVNKMQIISLLLICASLFGHHKVHSEEATAVQIVQLENQSISVNSNLIQQILGSERIKDRHVVVFSIAGPYRKGKSFFLNFPLKYLRAQVSELVSLNQCPLKRI